MTTDGTNARRDVVSGSADVAPWCSTATFNDVYPGWMPRNRINRATAGKVRIIKESARVVIAPTKVAGMNPELPQLSRRSTPVMNSLAGAECRFWVYVGIRLRRMLRDLFQSISSARPGRYSGQETLVRKVSSHSPSG